MFYNISKSEKMVYYNKCNLYNFCIIEVTELNRNGEKYEF